MIDGKNLVNRPGFMELLRRWHADLQERNRGERAELRRMRTPLEVCLSKAYQRGLVAELRRHGHIPDDPEAMEKSAALAQALALPAGVLAHARHLAAPPRHVAAMLAQSGKAGQDARDVRFRKLLAIPDEDAEGLHRMLVRLVRYMDDAIEPVSLLTGTMPWNDHARRTWAMHYYAAVPA